LLIKYKNLYVSGWENDRRWLEKGRYILYYQGVKTSKETKMMKATKTKNFKKVF